MFTLLILLVFIIIVAATWFVGLWNNLITFVNLIFAGMIASCWFEPVADTLESQGMASYTFVLDFLCLWGLFFLVFGALRICTDIVSKVKIKFDFWTEIVGRSISSICIASFMICFFTFSVHLAPLSESPFGGSFQATPATRNVLGIGPDRMWLGYLQSRSRGAFAESRNGLFGMLNSPATIYDDPEHERDAGKDRRVFDSNSDFIFKYHHRRQNFMQQESVRVNK